MLVKCGSGFFSPWAVKSVVAHEPIKGSDKTFFTVSVYIKEGNGHEEGLKQVCASFPNRKAQLDGVRRFAQKCNAITNPPPKKAEVKI